MLEGLCLSWGGPISAAVYQVATNTEKAASCLPCQYRTPLPGSACLQLVPPVFSCGLTSASCIQSRHPLAALETVDDCLGLLLATVSLAAPVSPLPLSRTENRW